MTKPITVTWNCPTCGKSGSTEVRKPRKDESKDEWVRFAIGQAVKHAHGLVSLMCPGQVRFDLLATRKQIGR